MIDTATGEFRLFADLPPLRREMSVAEFSRLYASHRVKIRPIFGREACADCQLQATLLGIPFHVSVYFDRERLVGISLVRSAVPPGPASWVGCIIYRLKKSLKGVPGPQMTEQEWCRETKEIHDEWVIAALGTTDPLRVWPQWGQIISRDVSGPMPPQILIDYTLDAEW